MNFDVMDFSMREMWSKLTMDERRQLLQEHKMWPGFVEQAPRPSNQDCSAEFTSAVALRVSQKRKAAEAKGKINAK